MRVLVATDAWHPAGQRRGAHADVAGAQRRQARRHDRVPVAGGFSVVPGADLSRACGWRCRAGGEIARRIEAAQARRDPYRDRRTDRLSGARLLPQARPAVHHELHDAISRIHLGARADPGSWIYAALRRFHAAAAVTMVATPSLMTELAERGFANLGMWTRGVDTDLFRPDRAIDLDLPRPIFITVGRVAIEKNLEAFLSLDLPGTKVVIGTGPQEAELKRQFPEAKFLGLLENGTLAAHLAARRRVRLSKPDRHVRRRAARSARLRRSDRGVSGHRAEGRRRRPSDRRPARRSARSPAWAR